MHSNKYILFFINKEQFAVNMDYVQSIEKGINIVNVPESPKYMKGIVYVRSEIVPIVDLVVKLNLDKTNIQRGEKQLIILETNQFKYGIEVDYVNRVYELEKNEEMELPKQVFNSENFYVNNVIKIEDSLLLSLNVDHLLEENELESLKEQVKKCEQ